MKICIIGAGAIGGLLAARLARAGEDVTIVARGVQLAAIRARGLTLIEENGERFTVKPRAVERLSEIEGQDLVVLGMKAHQVAAVAQGVPGMLAPQGLVLTAQNGIPWWYFFRHGGEHEGRVLESVDPGGEIARNLPIDRVVGSVVYPAAEIVEPGVIRLIEGNRFSLAEIDGAKSDRIQAISAAFTTAGFKAPVITDIRAEIWTKLWGNLSFNPVSALTGATLAGICRHPLARALAADMMREAQNVGEKLGVRFRIPLEKRLAGAEAVGEHKTSMLQDIEAKRPTEAAALVGSIVELGRIVDAPTPSINAIYACVRLLEETNAARA
ncbi:MAG: 2-dehydropantoate 2-reductase [Beijerinckiaceae bacterium]|nr:2-dehydropantoate 2-reductase [Beijerinckiaceae bacterium]